VELTQFKTDKYVLQVVANTSIY